MDAIWTKPCSTYRTFGILHVDSNVAFCNADSAHFGSVLFCQLNGHSIYRIYNLSKSLHTTLWPYTAL